LITALKTSKEKCVFMLQINTSYHLGI
jgi:hypothetical protein